MRPPLQLVETTPDSSAHDRLLEAAKRLFAGQGYENTTTHAIARLARTSESQLIKHFDSKEGLLEAVFEQGWTRIMRDFAALQQVASPRRRLEALVDGMLAALERDPALQQLFLFEGRRFRADGTSFLLTSGYLKLVELVDDLLQQLAQAGQLRKDIRPQTARSALFGMMEGLMRDQVIAARLGRPAPYVSAEIRHAFRLVLNSFAALAPGATGRQRKGKRSPRIA